MLLAGVLVVDTNPAPLPFVGVILHGSVGGI